jgi:hypothetical protein
LYLERKKKERKKEERKKERKTERKKERKKQRKKERKKETKKGKRKTSVSIDSVCYLWYITAVHCSQSIAHYLGLVREPHPANYGKGKG